MRHDALENRVQKLRFSALLFLVFWLLLLVIVVVSASTAGTLSPELVLFFWIDVILLTLSAISGFLWFQASNFLFLADLMAAKGSASIHPSVPNQTLKGGLTDAEKATMTEWLDSAPDEFIKENLTYKEFKDWERAGAPSLRTWIQDGMPYFQNWLEKKKK